MSANESMQLRSQCDGSCVPLTSTPNERSSRSSSVTRRVRHSELHHRHHHHHHHGNEDHNETTLQVIQQQSETDAIDPPCLDQHIHTLTTPNNGLENNGWQPNLLLNRMEFANNARFEEQTVLCTERRSVSMRSTETYMNSEESVMRSGAMSQVTAQAVGESDLCSSARTNHIHVSSNNNSSSSMSRRGWLANDTRRSIVATSQYGLDSESDGEGEEFTTFTTLVGGRWSSRETTEVRRSWLTVLKTLISRVLFISTKPVWLILYKLSAIMCIVDLWLLSRVGHFVRQSVHSNLKALVFALLLLLLSGMYYSALPTTPSDVSVLPTVSQLSTGFYNTLFNSLNAVGAAFGAVFNFSSSSSNQKASLNQVDLSDEDLRFRLRAMLREELAVLMEKEKQRQSNDIKETADKDKLRGEEMWKEILSLNSKVLSFEGQLNSFRHTENASITLSEHSQWLRQWLLTTLIEIWGASEDDDDELMKGIVRRLKRSFTSREDFLSLVSQILELREETRSKSGASGYTEEKLLSIIKREIALYDADQLGLADFALESSGGSVINTRCSETYTKHSSQVFVLGIPLWHVTSTPRTVIQPGRQPGECWPFVGSEGYIVIMLSRTIQPTAFSLEHIPRSISPTGAIDTAPKDFSVWGLKSEMDEGLLLGKYQYDQDASPLQTFAVQESDVGVFGLIELRIHSNHGHSEFTCVYRFRVHGIPEVL